MPLLKFNSLPKREHLELEEDEFDISDEDDDDDIIIEEVKEVSVKPLKQEKDVSHLDSKLLSLRLAFI